MDECEWEKKRDKEIVSKLIIAHEEIANKSNEIPALQKLIGELDETFSYGFDSMNTQKKL